MKLLFQSKEKDLVSAAKNWRTALNMDSEIKYFELNPYMAGETPEYTKVENPTGRAICHIEMTKMGNTYAVFRHDMFGIVIARKD